MSIIHIGSDPWAGALHTFLAGRLRAWGHKDAAMVEGHMLRNRKTGALAVILINWSGHLKNPVTIKIRSAGDMKNAKSVDTGQTFPLERKGDVLVMTMPKLDNGDILLLMP